MEETLKPARDTHAIAFGSFVTLVGAVLIGLVIYVLARACAG